MIVYLENNKTIKVSDAAWQKYIAAREWYPDVFDPADHLNTLLESDNPHGPKGFIKTVGVDKVLYSILPEEIFEYFWNPTKEERVGRSSYNYNFAWKGYWGWGATNFVDFYHLPSRNNRHIERHLGMTYGSSWMERWLVVGVARNQHTSYKLDQMHSHPVVFSFTYADVPGEFQQKLEYEKDIMRANRRP